MTPQDFICAYPHTGRDELAKMTGSSKTLVDHWFCDGASRKTPVKRVLLILHLIHVLRQYEAELGKYKEYVHGR